MASQHFITAFKDSFGFLRTALSGTTKWTDRNLRQTGVVLSHIAKTDVFSYNVQINHDKQLGTNIADFHIHLVPIGAVTGGEKIAVDYAWGWYSYGDVIPSTLPNTGTATFTLSTGDEYKHLLMDIVTDMAHPATEIVSSFFLIKCTRRNDSQDTYNGEFALLGADIHYAVNRNGSVTRLG